MDPARRDALERVDGLLKGLAADKVIYKLPLGEQAFSFWYVEVILHNYGAQLTRYFADRLRNGFSPSIQISTTSNFPTTVLSVSPYSQGIDPYLPW